MHSACDKKQKLRLDSLCDSYFEFLTNEKRCSYNTIQTYVLTLNKVVEFWKKHNCISLDCLTGELLDLTFTFINDPKLSRRSVAQKSNIIRSFFKFVGFKYKVEIKLFLCHIPTIKYTKKVILPIDTKLIHLILDDNCKSFKEFRNRAILSVLFSSAIRVSELVNLTFADFNKDTKQLLITQAKGDVERYVPMTDLCIHHVCDYIRFCNNHEHFVFNRDTPLFVNRFYKKITTRAVEMSFSELKRRYKIKQDFTPHIIRHTVAVNFLNQGADIAIVQKLLGHKSILATQQYLQMDLEKVIKRYQETFNQILK